MNKLKLSLTIISALLALVFISQPTHAVRYEYDDLGRLTEATYDSGKKITYTYDAGGNILKVEADSGLKLTPIGNKSVYEGAALEFTVSANAFQGTNLTYSASNLPSGAVFNNATHVFTWVTQVGQAGAYSNVRFEVSDGNQLVSEEITITVKASNNVAVGCWDSPVDGKTINGRYNVNGWYYEPSGVSKIEVFIDGVLSGTAAYGLSRADVPKVYPWCGTKTGFSYSLNTLTLAEGAYTLHVKITANDGKETVLTSRTITVKSLGVLDHPRDGSTISGVYDVAGWYYNTTGVAKVEVLVDGAVYGMAVYGLSRPDVSLVYPEIGNNSGYNYKLDTTKLSEGTHTISVCGFGNNGVQTTLKTVTVTVIR